MVLYLKYLGLVFAEGQGEVSVQQSVLLHEHHAVFVGVTLGARYQAAGGSETQGEDLRVSPNQLASRQLLTLPTL